MNTQSPTTGWLHGVCHLPSPHYNERPDGVAVDLLVIHNISLPPGEFGGGYVDALFCGTLDCNAHSSFDPLRNLQVSAHFFINRNGEVTQYVSLDQRAWHAGKSRWDGRENCNDFSVGIELEGTDTVPYTDVQYIALQKLVRDIVQYFPLISTERMIGHSDVAPGRKTDPGESFDWLRFRQGLLSP